MAVPVAPVVRKRQAVMAARAASAASAAMGAVVVTGPLG